MLFVLATIEFASAVFLMESAGVKDPKNTSFWGVEGVEGGRKCARHPAPRRPPSPSELFEFWKMHFRKMMAHVELNGGGSRLSAKRLGRKQLKNARIGR